MLYADATPDHGYADLIEKLDAAGYERNVEDLKPFQLRRKVDPRDGGEPIAVIAASAVAQGSWPARPVKIIAPLIVVAHPGFAPNTIGELIALAKRDPGKINYGSAGPGTAQHMTGELFKSQAGIDLTHVPYKGSAPAMTDLLGGQIPMMFDSLTSALPHIRGGKLKAIAITTANRSPELPNVPTIGETVAGFDAAGWSGIVLPKGTPTEIVNKVSADIQRLLKESSLRDEILKRGSIPDPTTPQQFADFIRSENAKWEAVAKAAQVKLD